MPNNQELERICNVAGYPIYEWAASQLKKRSELGSGELRQNDDLIYLANKTAWVRVVSSANFEENFRNYLKSTYQLGLPNDRSLAENFILYGGTSTYAFESQQLNLPTLGINNIEIGDLNGSTTRGMNLRSGLDSYNLLGQQEIKDFGYKPMPGISSVTVESTGRMGSLRQATINFKVWDKYQLDIMDALYFRLGFTILLEWGHAKYYDNAGKIQSSEQFMINPFEAGLTKEDIGLKISTNIRQSYGNYGGMLGLVTSFNFTLTQDGGYDCIIKVTALGSVLGNYAITHKSSLANVYFEQLKLYLSNEKSKEKSAILKQIELDKQKAIEEAQNKIQSSESLWAKLDISDKLSNVLFNTNSKNAGDFQVFTEYKNNQNLQDSGDGKTIVSETAEVLPVRKIYTRTGEFIAVPGLVIPEEISNLDVEYYKKRSKTLLDNFKIKQNLSKSSTVEGLEIYYIKDGIVFFGETSQDNLKEKYIAITSQPQQKSFGNISVKLDTDYLYRLVNNKIDGVTLLNLDIKIGDRKSSTNYVDILFQESGDNMSYQKNNIKFSITLDISGGSIDTAKSLFSNPNTEYYIDSIETDISSHSKIVLSVKNNSEYKIILGNKISDYSDFGIITSIIGPQNLRENKFLQERNAAIQKAENDALAQLSQKERDLQNEYNAEALRGTVDSESTIELMLRSILLYGVNNATNRQLLSRPEYKDFIKNLFSEGVYAPIFNKGIPWEEDYSKYDDEFFKKYISGTLNSLDRLEANLRYGNNFYLMSGENAYKNDSNSTMILKNQMAKGVIPQVNFKELFKIVPVPYGESCDLEVSSKPKLSVYINLGLFFLMLNHTSLLYNKETVGKLKTGDTLTPVTYLDFNPETNFYLSSINQISIDPYKFIVPYIGKNQDYKKLFNKTLIENDSIKAVLPKLQDTNQQIPIQAPTPLFDFSNDKLSGALPQQKIPKFGGKPDGYIGRLMNVMVDINYLLQDVIQTIKNSSSTNEAYFQTVIEKILTDLNKSMGLYNSFRLSYSDTANCYVITDDQIQIRPDESLQSVHSSIVNSQSDEYEIPIYGKKSIARSFNISTDLSSRLASLIAISSNPGIQDQVSNSKNTSDFGIYNSGSFDRYLPYKFSDPSNSEDESSNLPAAQLAINFNNVVKSIYSISREDGSENQDTLFISRDSINKAMSYYIDKMAKVKNEQPESLHAMIIPVKSNVVMDGMSGLFPFQLYTIDERLLPYRYSSINLSDGAGNLRKTAFSISKISHTISDNQWTTSIDGFMTLIRNPSKGQSEVRDIIPTQVEIQNQDIIPEQINISLPRNANLIYQFFTGKSTPKSKEIFTSEQASAFVGNFWQESRLNPNATQVSTAAPLTPNVGYGLAQWTIKSRQDKLRMFAYKKNKSVSDLYTQLEFVVEELQKDYPNVLSEIKTSSTVEQATKIIMNKYERPKAESANFNGRLAAANTIFKDNTSTLT
jgi:hypothetical protein